METQKSILLVTVDCLRADHVGFLGYHSPTTPFLDSLAEESVVFPAAIVAGAPTYYSLPAMLASRYPLAFGREVLGIGPNEATIVSAFQRTGYATAAFCAANPYISSRFGYAQGFDLFRDFLDEKEQRLPDERGVLAKLGKGWAGRLNRSLERASSSLGLRAVYDELYFRYCQRVTPVPEFTDALRPFPSADVIVDHATEWLASIGNQPFFLWLHFMDPHAPYYPKDAALALMREKTITPFRARYLNSFWNRSDLGVSRLARRRKEIIALYDAAIRWVDVQMARFVKSLQRAGTWENCILAFTADHGEEFLDHAGRYHPPSGLMEEVIRVPLLLRVPGRPKMHFDTSPFSMIHLGPTLLDSAGVSIPNSFEGRSWWPDLTEGARPDAVAFSESVYGCTNPFHRENRMGHRILSVRERRFKLVLNFDSGEEDLYDLDKDPQERAPLPRDAEKSVRRHLLQLAQAHLQRPIDRRMSMSQLLGDLQLEWSARAPKSSLVSC